MKLCHIKNVLHHYSINNYLCLHDNTYLQVAEYFVADKPKTVEGRTLVCRRTVLVLTFPSRVRFCAQHLA